MGPPGHTGSQGERGLDGRKGDPVRVNRPDISRFASLHLF